MKKQILILTFLSLALIFAGLKSYGQNEEPDYLDAAPSYCVPAQPLACAASATGLNPIPGQTYNYSITVAAAGATVHWFVTDDPNVLAAGALTADIDADDGAGDYILDAEDGVYNVPTNTTLDIDISWKAFDAAANEVLLVAYALDAAGCTDNIEVYRIEPQFSFTLDIAGLLDDGTEGAEECVSPVVAATYDGTNLTMDYGENYVFFTVNAANWVHSWTPTFTASGGGGSTLGTPQWAYPDEASGAGSVWHDATDVIESSHYGGATAIGDAGECIVVRVPVTHGGNEIDVDDGAATVTLAVNGIMYDPATTSYPAGNADLTDGGAGNPCTQVDLDDTFDYTLTPRPAVNEVDPTPFVPKN